jgi:hypothetical protein
MTEKYLRTTSFYPAVFLLSKGLELVGINKTNNPKRVEFVFSDKETAKYLLEKYNFAKKNDNEVLIDARVFVTSIKLLKEKIYQVISNF